MRAVLLLSFGLAACGAVSSPPMPEASPTVIKQGAIETAANGRCFAIDTGPERTESIVEEVLTLPEQRDADGTVLRPAIYRQEERDVLVPINDPVRFEVVCPQIYSQSFVASLQRALSARGAYSGAANGLLDGATQNAILLYQTARGRHSAQLSVATAREFGLISDPS